MEDRGGDWDPEFDDPPFDLIPYEIVAIYKVRERLGLGLGTPTIEHPLITLTHLSPKNGSPMPPASGIDDPILKQVEERYSEYFPAVGAH